MLISRRDIEHVKEIVADVNSGRLPTQTRRPKRRFRPWLSIVNSVDELPVTLNRAFQRFAAVPSCYSANGGAL